MEYWKTKEEVFSPLAEHSWNKSLRIDNAGCSPDTKAIRVEPTVYLLSKELSPVSGAFGRLFTGEK
jgi:hypothetical protein